MRYQGVFFDFDYTLGDSSVAILKGYQDGFRALGQPAPTLEQVRPTIGMTLMDGYALLTGDKDPEHGKEFYHQFQMAVGELAGAEGTRVMEQDSKLLPGAVELLTALKLRGVDVAIVSTKLSVTIRQIFAYNHADHLLDVVIGGKDVKHHKPDPEGLCLAMDELGLAEADYQFYTDLRKYGTTRHSGFGLGFERCVMYLTGMGNIRDVIPFPRTVNNCDL